MYFCCFSTDKAVNSEVITVKAIDPDNVFQLSYTIEDPKKAWDTRGREVDPQVFDFRVSNVSYISNKHLKIRLRIHVSLCFEFLCF